MLAMLWSSTYVHTYIRGVYIAAVPMSKEHAYIKMCRMVLVCRHLGALRALGMDGSLVEKSQTAWQEIKSQLRPGFPVFCQCRVPISRDCAPSILD